MFQFHFFSTQDTVSRRAALAQEFVAASQEQVEICERVIHDQHMQHQGWLAVVANVEDTATALRKQCAAFVAVFNDYLAKKEGYHQAVENFDEDLAVLHRIPVFPSLLEAEAGDRSMVGSVILDPDRGDEGGLTLLGWIQTRGSPQPLEEIAERCYRALGSLTAQSLEELEADVAAAVEASLNENMKEIKGVGDRLQRLEKLLLSAKKTCREQRDLGQAFAQNQARSSGLRDASILPDLCASHREQLRVMTKNYAELADRRRRCASAKLELCASLHSRMKWVVEAQSRMAVAGQRIVMYKEQLRHFVRRMEVIEQLHIAPSMYITAAVEVVRRRAFSEHYLERSRSLSDRFTRLHGEELAAREAFQAKMRRHFLSKMFPGMDDLPPEFATARPADFDDRLPAITLDDVERLRRDFPDLAQSLQLPDGAALANLLSRSMNQSLTQEDGQTLFSLKNMSRNIHLNGEVN